MPLARVATLLLPNGVMLEHIAGGGASATPVPAADPADAMWRMIEAHVSDAAGRLAVATPDGAMTYAELIALARAIAAAVPPERNGPLAVLGAAGPMQPAALLACLWTGRPLVSLDPQDSPRRLSQMLGQAAPALLLHAPETPPPAWRDSDLPVLSMADLPPAGDWTPPAHIAGDPDAYIVFTSGSTGVPKGVVHRASSLLSAVLFKNREMCLQAGDRLAIATPTSTVAIPLKCGQALVAGATLLMMPQRLSLGSFVQLLHRHAVTQLACYVGFARILCTHPEARAALARLRILHPFGDRVTAEDCRVLCAVLPKDAGIFLSYGLSECVTPVAWTWRPALAASEEKLPIGRAATDMSLWLDPTTTGVSGTGAGELYASGPRVARGYWRNRAATEAAFITDPLVPAHVVYKTGDLVRRRADGMLEHAGRVDNQIKLRGWRIEIEEVEAAARTLAGVRAAGIVPRRDAHGLVESLMLHVAMAEGAAFDAAAVLAGLATLLPVHMLPAIVLEAQDLPLTATGKVDRLRLQEIDQQVRDREQHVPAGSSDDWPDALSRRIAAIIAEGIGHADVEPDHLFRELGGDSLEAVNISLRLEKQFAVDIDPERLLGEDLLGVVVAEIAAQARRR